MSTTHPMRYRLLSLLLCLITAVSCLSVLEANASVDIFSYGLEPWEMWIKCKEACSSKNNRSGKGTIQWSRFCKGNSTQQVFVFDVATDSVKNAPSLTFTNSKVTKTFKKISSTKTKTKTGYGEWEVYVYTLTDENAEGYTSATKYTISGSSKKIKLAKGSTAYYRFVVRYTGDTIKTPSWYYAVDSSTASLKPTSWSKCHQYSLNFSFW